MFNKGAEDLGSKTKVNLQSFLNFLNFKFFFLNFETICGNVLVKGLKATMVVSNQQRTLKLN